MDVMQVRDVKDIFLPRHGQEFLKAVHRRIASPYHDALMVDAVTAENWMDNLPPENET